MDSIDDANRVADMLLEVAIHNARPKGRALLPKGTCHYCESEVENPQQLFCDIHCSMDHEKLLRKQRMQKV